jgi:hypothetical protein
VSSGVEPTGPIATPYHVASRNSALQKWSVTIPSTEMTRAIWQQLVFQLLLGLGLLVGLGHFILWWSVLFVSGGNLLIDALGLLSGPFLTLPAVVISLFSRRVGGSLLVIGSVVSLATTAIADIEVALTFAWMVSVPMLLLGVGFLWCARRTFPVS